MPYTAADFLDARGLSLRQPYSDLIALGAKRVETRSRDIGARPGTTVAIHAGLKTFRDHECPVAWDRWRGIVGRQVAPGGLGCILAVARVSAVLRVVRDFPRHEFATVRGDALCLGDAMGGDRRASDEVALGDWSEGRFLIVLSDVVRLRGAVPCKGSLGLFRLKPEVVEAVRAQVLEAT